MKRLLIISIFVLTASALWSQSDHSKIKLDCSFCHSCEKPTKINPCLKACPREEMITVYHTPSQGPEYLIINQFEKFEDLYEPVNFSHRAHSEMAEMSGGCELCHHYNPPGSIAKCVDCHDVNRLRADLSKPDLKGAYHRQCIDCHRTWNNNVACADCHELKSSGKTAAKIKPLSASRIHPEIIEPAKIVYETETSEGKFVTFYHNEHTQLFGLECSNCHKNESCASCHKVDDMKSIKLTVEEKHQACINCHKVENNCSYCHSNKTLEPFDHGTRTGFQLKSYHQKLSCVNCHAKPKAFSGLNSKCASCHGSWSVDNFNHKATGLILDEIHAEFDCDVCHSLDNYSKPGCDACHEDMTYPKFKPGRILRN